MKSVCVPAGYLLEYLQAGSLSDSMALLVGQSLPVAGPLERALDLSLELGLLLAATPIPDRLQDKLLCSLDGLGSRLVIRAKGLGCGPSGLELGVAATRAQALEYIRAGWARAWSPSALLASHFLFPFTDKSMETMPEIEVVEADETSMVAGAENPGRGLGCGLELGLGQETLLDQGVEFLPDGSVVWLDAGSLKVALDKAEDALEQAEDALPRRLPGAAAEMENLAGWIRYAFGQSYNNWNLPAEAFAFMDLLLPACHRPETTPEHHATHGHKATPGDHGTSELPVGLESELPDALVALWQLALRATSLQLTLPPAQQLSYQSAAGGILPQQLTGLAAAPGRTSGIASRSGERPQTQPEPSSNTVIICERLSLPLMAAKPAAVLERSGSRIGLGVLLAKDAGIPCISGIEDLATLSDGLTVMVDGHLGLVTINRNPGRL